MAIVKVIEVLASSEKSFDDAVKQAVLQASESIKGIKSVYIKEMKAEVKDNNVVSYGINAKISFEVQR